MSDIVYGLTKELRFDVTLAVTMGGGVVNLGKKMNVLPGDSVIFIYDGHPLGTALILEVGPRKRGLLVAHGPVMAMGQDQYKRLESMRDESGHIHARGGAYLGQMVLA